MDPLEYSRYARHLIGARPELRAELSAAEGWTRGAMRAFLAERPARDEASLHAALRALRQRVVLRTMARDLAGQAPLAEVCAAMSSLAEVAVETALAFLEPAIESALGVPVAGGERQRLVVIGMGKLGGAELNVSSDVDLVFLYPEEGETRASTGSARTVPNLEFFTRLGRRLIAALGEATGDGFVFRVDMRLRPWGDDGPLATPFDALEEYFVTQGREWERYAWIKARALAGRDHPALAQIVRPFVYRKYLDYGAIAAMRELHAQIRAEVARRELADHIKLGPGGIREIEFIAQAFQLIRGGRDASLQVRPTLEVLELLAAKGLLPRPAVGELSEAYVFLRRLEHRLQYLDDAQTHELPRNDEDRARVARAMGFDSWDAFREGLERHRARVSWHFEQVFSVEERPRHALAPIWSAPPDDAPAKLAALGYRDPGAAAARLAAVRSGSRYGGLPQTSRERFDELVPRLIEAAAAQENPDTTLARGLDFAETVSRRAAYLALLDEHPAVLARLAQLLGASSWAAEYLNRHPVLVDELLDARTLFAAPDWSAFAQSLRRELAERAGDEERQMDWLREAHHAQVFRLLAQDLSGELTVERLADHLSDLADVMLQVALELAWSQLRVRHRDIPRFAVIAYGKLGGKELGYASDLDLIFLHDDEDERAQEIYARLAQRMSRLLTSRTAAGVLFDIDLRLRPDGEGGMVVSSIDAFRRYQREAAWTWEHQALTRARWSAGDAAVGAAFEDERRRVLRTPRDAAKLREDVLSMRKQLLEGHPNTSDLFDLKHDRGGMIDIEFVVQYLVLAHAHAHPELVANDGNIALLRMAARLGLVPEEAAEAVGSAYRELRRLQHKLRLNGARYARVAAEEVRAHTGATLALWREVFGAD
ncbi:MAG TPA: bifunctional [glutamate--ammonia ligase]-adenylyl-L-tyrosine phosphorylase/[glutamate--ammonia-ligase] adenylyltransferase [Burkholderiales bacterium]|nr:bifunctional [glutamate--ammonia ligase]-adenylyl-L-tyrosine phosphorylase/[glutamate--ammonia-ligase] adenylyltransferase [Burkholderiales bacterium]